jgi:hypothetical protein
MMAVPRASGWRQPALPGFCFMLILSLVLVVLPLVGVGLILTQGWLTTVDGLFMSLILLAMSGIFALSAVLEFRAMRAPSTKAKTPGGATAVAFSGPRGEGIRRERGLVESVSFYEAQVGEPNKSLVVLRDGASGSRVIAFEGDLRNLLPTGKRVEITCQPKGKFDAVVEVQYI